LPKNIIEFEWKYYHNLYHLRYELLLMSTNFSESHLSSLSMVDD